MRKIFTIFICALLFVNVFVILSPAANADGGCEDDENSQLREELGDLAIDGEDSQMVPSMNRRLTLFEGLSTSPVIVSGNENVLHMAWADARDMGKNISQRYMTIFYKQSYDYGNTWTPDTPLSTRYAQIAYVDLAVDGNSIAIAWEEASEVFIIFSANNGLNWGEPYPISMASEPSIAIHDINLYVFYKNQSVSAPFIDGVRLSWDPLLTTPELHNINPSGGGPPICSIADVAVEGDFVHVAIKDDTLGQLHYLNSTDNGTTWNGDVITNCTGEDQPGSIMITARENNVKLVWSDNRSGTYQLYTKTSYNNGTTWDLEIKISDTSGNSLNPSIQLDSEQITHVCWEETGIESSHILYKSLDMNGNVILDSSITDGASTSINPTMTIDSSDHYYVAWQDDCDEDQEIYFTTNLREFENNIEEIKSYIENLPDECFDKNPSQRRSALVNLMGAIERQICKGQYTGAINILEKNMLKIMDGYTGGNSNNDWITDPIIQQEFSGMISGLITGLELKSYTTQPIGGSEWCDVGTAMDTLIQLGKPRRHSNSEWSGIYTEGARNYRLGTNTPNFWLDIENAAWSTNIDYRITFVFKASANIEVQQLSGPSWRDYKPIGTISGNSAWKTCSIETNSLWNYDVSTANTYFNLLFAFDATLLLDSISVIPIEYHCEVGTSGDNSVSQHDPGICIYPNSEWSTTPIIIDGIKCKLGSNTPNLYTNLPDTEREYRIEIRYRSKDFSTTNGAFREWKGSGYNYFTLGTFICDQGWHTSIFITEKEFYNDHNGGVQGYNVLFEFTKEVYVDKLRLTVARDYCDVGIAGDNDALSHEPGVSIYQTEWNSATIVDGKTVRWAPAGSNFYLNEIDVEKDYVIRITYKSPSDINGKIRQWDGSVYHTIGEYISDGSWRTVTVISKAFWNIDHNGYGHTYGLNILFEFDKGLWVDEISIAVMEKYALLIGGGSTNPSENYDAFKNDLFDMYNKIKTYIDWNDDNIFCYLWKTNAGTYNYKGLSIKLDGWGCVNNMATAITEIGCKITSDDFFYFTLISHADTVANPDDCAFELYYQQPGGGDSEQAVRFSTEAPGWVDSLKKMVDDNIGQRYVRSVFIFQTCHSGYAITGLAKPNRIVMSASMAHEDAWCEQTGDDHHAFLYRGRNWIVQWWPGVILSLGSPSSPSTLEYSFNKGYIAATNNHKISHPQISGADLAKYTWL